MKHENTVYISTLARVCATFLTNKNDVNAGFEGNLTLANLTREINDLRACKPFVSDNIMTNDELLAAGYDWYYCSSSHTSVLLKRLQAQKLLIKTKPEGAERNFFTLTETGKETIKQLLLSSKEMASQEDIYEMFEKAIPVIEPSTVT